jgi:hypothetical protein
MPPPRRVLLDPVLGGIRDLRLFYRRLGRRADSAALAFERASTAAAAATAERASCASATSSYVAFAAAAASSALRRSGSAAFQA